jgi:ABC-2 type transport system permease protein
MTAFFALVRKDLILFLSDRRALLVNLLLPIVIGAFFGYLFGGSGEAKSGRIEVALVQLDTSASGQEIAAALKTDPALTIVEMPLAQAREAVKAGKQKAAIVIPAGFGKAAGAALFGAGKKPEIDVLYDPSQPAVLAMVKGMLTQHVMQTVSQDMFNGSGGKDFTERAMAEVARRGATDPDSVALRDFLGQLHKFQTRAPTTVPDAGAAEGATNVATAVAKTRPAGMSVPFSTRDQQISSSSDTGPKGYNGYAHSFAGMSVQFILFMGVDMGIGILLARRLGIWNRLLAAPVSLRTVLLARATSAAMIALGLLTATFLFAVLVFGVRISNPLGFFGVAVCFAILTATFGLLIAAFGKTPEAARGLSVFATLIMVMLGGAWVPSFMFPPWVQKVTVVVPTRWAIDGFDAMTWRGQGLQEGALSMAVLLGFSLLFGVLAMWQFGREQRSK